MEEIWRDIDGYEGLYQVSNMGNVKSLVFRNRHGVIYREKILKNRISTTMCYDVQLGKKYKFKNYKVHRLVAQTFLPNPENKLCVDHIDGDRSNNHVSNLRWCTISENMYNQKTQTRTKSSIYKGVCFDKKVEKWISYIKKDKKQNRIGRFKSQILGAIAYDEKALELFGEYAKLNFPIIRVLKSKYS
jgi:hypothetical protein